MSLRTTRIASIAVTSEPVFGLMVLAFALVALGGCTRQEASGLGPGDPGAVAAMAMAAAPANLRAPDQRDTLAYEHTISIELSKETLPDRVREIEAACAADRASGCTILDVSLRSHEDLPNGSIRMRLASRGVGPIIEMAAKDGKVIARTTQAEDLAQPVADTERQLALLSLHRDRLAQFMKSKEIKIDQLITISKELATVQTQIDSLGAERANLQRRIDTDLLTIQLTLPQQDYVAERSPVMDALRFFGSDFREAIGQVIRFVAILLPWLIIIVPGVIVLRLFWRWITRWLARRERRGAEGAA